MAISWSMPAIATNVSNPLISFFNNHGNLCFAPELNEANLRKAQERERLSERLNREMAELENSTKLKSNFALVGDGLADGTNDATMESQSFSIPSMTADWFNMDTIAEVERQSLPEFFRGVYPSKTPSTYKEYRDFMIKLYRMNPQSYLAATSKFSV